jgi:hypothetical protein
LYLVELNPLLPRDRDGGEVMWHRTALGEGRREREEVVADSLS